MSDGLSIGVEVGPDRALLPCPDAHEPGAPHPITQTAGVAFAGMAFDGPQAGIAETHVRPS